MVCIVHSQSWWSRFCICSHLLSGDPPPFILSPLLSMPRPISVPGILGKENDVADVDVNFMLLYSSCNSCLKYIVLTICMIMVTFRANWGGDVYIWIKYWKFYQLIYFFGVLLSYIGSLWQSKIKRWFRNVCVRVSLQNVVLNVFN